MPLPHLDVSVAAVPTVYLSELHYDNVGTDAEERIEINGPAGTDLTGWSVVLYNGNGGAAYNTRALTELGCPSLPTASMSKSARGSTPSTTTSTPGASAAYTSCSRT